MSHIVLDDNETLYNDKFWTIVLQSTDWVPNDHPVMDSGVGGSGSWNPFLIN